MKKPLNTMDKLVIAILLIAIYFHYNPGGSEGKQTSGLHALIVEDRATKHLLEPEQVVALGAKEVEQYLNSHCIEVNGQPAWRRIDKETTGDKIKETYPYWKEKMDQTDRKSYPWLYLDKGSKHVSVPYPKDTKSALATLRSVGGK